MKKLITLSLLLLTIISVSAKDLWTSTTYAEWKTGLEKLSNEKTKTVYQGFDSSVKYCFETDLTKVPYKDFKNAIISKVEKGKGLRTILTLVVRIKPATRYLKDVLADDQLSKGCKRALIFSKYNRILLKNCGIEIPAETYREWCLELIKTKRLAYAKPAVDFYVSDIADSLKPETVLADMKMAKRLLYVNVGSDDWKPVLVKIELLIKANE